MATYSTIWCEEKPGFPEDFVVFPRRRIGALGVFGKIRNIKPGDAILLNGAMGVNELWIDMLFGVYMSFFKRDVVVLISDATWHPRTVAQESRVGPLHSLYAFFLKSLFRLTRGPNVHYCFLSTTEADLVAIEANVPRSQIHFTPFCTQLPLDILAELREIAGTAARRESGRELKVFSGGNSLRDYETLIAAAKDSEANFLIASSNRHQFDPRNITFGYFSHHDFFREMARSDVVVVPLLDVPGRSVGQQTYLNALALGKPLIVTDVIGVRDHLVAGRHALLVPPGDVDAMRRALDWMADPHNREARAEMVEQGLKLAADMTFAHYAARLAKLLLTIQCGTTQALAKA